MLAVLFMLLLVGEALANVPVDSMALESTLARLEPSARVELLLDRAEAIRRNDPRTAIVLAERARAVARDLGDDRSLARAEMSIGIGHYFTGEYRQAMEAYQAALETASTTADNANIASALNNIGILYFVWGEHDLAIDHYLQSVRIHEQVGDRKGLAKGYNNVAGVMHSAGEYDQALDYYQRSLAIYEELGNLALMASSLNNIGLVHYDRQEYGQAMAAYEQALEYGRRSGDKQDTALTLNNLGQVFEARGRYDDALAHYDASLVIREELGDRQGALVCRHNIGVVQSTRGEHELAITTLEGALSEARDLEILELIRDNLESLALVLQRAGQPRRALTIYMEYKAADGELRDQERTRQMFAAKTLYEVDLKDREIQVLRKDKKMEQSRRNALMVGAVLSLLIIILLFQRYRFQKRAADEIRRTNEALRRAHAELEQAARDELAHVARVTTMGELAAAFAHELNQPLAAILANARAGRNYLGRETPDPGETDAALADIGDDAGRAQEIITNLRRLMRKGEIRRERVAVEMMVTDALKVIGSECARRGVAVEFKPTTELSFVTGDRVQLQQVVLNLVQNATTVVAASDLPQPVLTVRTARVDDETVVVEVEDRGPPVSDEVFADMFEPFFTTRADGLGMGLAICRTIIEAHGGTLTARRNEGTGLTVAFRLPLANDTGPASQ